MPFSPSYVIVSPVRNEGKFLSSTIKCVAQQSLRPNQWIIVNDGSSDDTLEVANSAATTYPWITVVNRHDRGVRKAGSGVIEAFYDGFQRIEDGSWSYLVKLDGDLSLPHDYFEKCILHFNSNPRIGIAGGTVCIINNDGLPEVESKVDPKFHVRGATKVYRKECWDQIGGLLKAPGWDTLDEVKANMLGWETQTIPGLNIIHHRPTGAAYGAWKDRVKNGMGCYISGYHPLFMAFKCCRRLIEKPLIIGGVGLFYGFLKGYITRTPQIQDKALIKYFRNQQLNRLFLKNSLWD
jgi:biofilm PGA synthesis N-glycosyltransferase PgaC